MLFVIVNALLVIGQYVNRGPLGLKVEEGTVKYLYADENPEIYRPGGFSTDPNIAASIFATFMPILLIRLVAKRKLWAGAHWIVIGLVTTALVLTGSRSAWVVTALMSFFVLRYLLVKRRFKIYIPAFIRKYWVVFLLFFLILLGYNIITRISTLLSIFNKEGGGSYRLEHIKIGWYYLTSIPFGIGIGTFPFKMALDFPVEKTTLIPNLAHNMFAQVGAETGVLGIVSFLTFLWLVIKEKYRAFSKSHNLLDLALLVAFISFLLLSNFFPWFLHPKLDWFFWILASYGLSRNPMVE
jgi:O-antigen ligase